MAKISTIAKSFIQPLPVDEDWYQKRRTACDSCEYNTLNMSSDQISFTDKLKEKTGVCPVGACSICGCCVDRKASVKTEMCALAQKNQTPKWEALEFESKKDTKVSCINLSEDKATLSLEANMFVMDVHDFDPLIEIKFQVKRSGRLDYKTIIIPCSCTVPQISVIDKETIEVTAKISTLKFREGLNEKSLSIQYWTGNNKYTDTTVKFKIIKP